MLKSTYHIYFNHTCKGMIAAVINISKTRTDSYTRNPLLLGLSANGNSKQDNIFMMIFLSSSNSQCVFENSQQTGGSVNFVE